MWNFFIVVLAKEINLISLAQRSKPVLEEGDFPHYPSLKQIKRGVMPPRLS